MGRKREARVKVWSSIDPDSKLKLEILAERSGLPEWYHVRKAIENYVADVRAVAGPAAYVDESRGATPGLVQPSQTGGGR